jgi:hypothetical protein
MCSKDMSWLVSNLSHKLDYCFKYNIKMNFNIIKNYLMVINVLRYEYNKLEMLEDEVPKTI